MPILAAEPAMFPTDILDDPEDPLAYEPAVSLIDESGVIAEPDVDQMDDSATRRWVVLHTKSRQEKSLARELNRYEIPFYLPLVAKTNVIRGRKVQSRIPLFSSYVFLFASDEERARSLVTNRVTTVLPVPDGDLLRHDLKQIQLLIENGAPMTIESRLAVGRRVRIRGGQLAGLEGIVLRRCRQVRLVVAVQFIQQGVSLEIDDHLVEPVDFT